MSLSSQDELHLRRALELAREAAPLVSPNPTVGCVIARGHDILGEGEHRYDDRDHAEIVALKQAAFVGVTGATAFVTLEPCSHHGRTPPCANALIAAGIARCVVTTIDPNPLVRGEGIARMRAGGIEVVVLNPDSPLARQARALNDAFAFSVVNGGLPFITLKAALSVDGKLAPPPAQRIPGTSFWLTGEAARADVQQLRHVSDALLTGIGTVLADDPQLTDRTNRPRRRPLLRIVLDANLRTPLTSRVVRSANGDVLLFCRASAPEVSEIALRACGVDIYRLPDDRESLDLQAVREVLAGRAIRSVLVEAGSRANASFLGEDLVQKVVLYYAERELGLDAVPFAAGVPSPYLLQQRLTQVTRATFPAKNSEDIRISGYLHDPWAGVDGEQ